MAETNKTSLKGYLDRVLGEEGVKTDVSITLTTNTMITIVVGLVTAGACIAVIANILKNIIKNHQAEEIKTKMEIIIKHLNQLRQ
ncbi:hypothetical protein GCM10009122_23290 [Fulvivirga kasyanovii]|uniref:Uncharacterized protein n=1 Tax=Fulvivirga kasyanovii TaxID=396812 RepID=A0ABW9S0E2_9BACT|nr:hypothetical protein [Fulvivirga kasyanovii]MTI28965.1 hypothetical protein [Fulvivirga kasyanovii]